MKDKAAQPDTPGTGHSGVRLATDTAVTIYNEGIAPRLVELVTKHRARKRSDELTWIASLGIALVVGSIGYLATSAINGVLLGLLAGGGAQWALSRRPRPDIRLAMRQEIYKPLCDAAGISYALAPMQSNAESFASFGLVGKFDNSRFENQLAGSYKGIVFLQTDALLTQNGAEHSSVVFNGLLSVFELPRRFVGQTLVLKSDQHLQKVAEQFQQAPERVELGDWTFEQSFEVYATDAQEARSIITPVLRGQLLALQQMLGFDIQFAFTGTTMIMSVDLTANAFDITDPAWAANDPRRLHTALTRFQAIFETLDVLQLNSQSKSPFPL